MIYLDYSATTPVNKEILDTFNQTCLDFVGNSNSMHKLGVASNKLEKQATKQIADLLNIKQDEVIYTSGSTEANNLAIKGICLKYQNRGKHIITTNFEHSSIYGPIGYLQKLGFVVDFVETNKEGLVEINELKKLITDQTILISISAVNSETGLRQNVEAIGNFLKDYHKCFFHVDATQCIGKDNIDLTNIDLCSFSAHKFYGLKGIGALIKKEGINLDVQINGGKSTTKFRSGTPALPLIVSLSKALRLSLNDIDNKSEYILKLNNYLKDNLKKYDKVVINSNNNCLPHILNFSVLGVKPETMQHALEEYDIYISTQSACSSNNPVSKAVLALTKDEERASHSVRISISSLTTKEEIDKFLEVFNKCYQQLQLK